MEVGRERTTLRVGRRLAMNNICLLLLALIILISFGAQNSNLLFIIALAILGLGAGDKLNFLI